jgi:hypothetical protein
MGFIKDIKGLFLKILMTVDQNSPKGHETIIFVENLEKSGQFITDNTEYYGQHGNCYHVILRDITVPNISYLSPAKK